VSNLHALQMALIDTQSQMQRELQFSADAKKQINDAFGTVQEALDDVRRVVSNAFDERMRALSIAIGTGAPSPETVTVVAAEQTFVGAVGNAV
jgi:signal transduction histidine kinase